MKKVIYQAHGFHFFKGAPFLNWIFYYPVEALLSYWTDILITINQEDYNRAIKNFHAKKIEYIPGVGVDINQYTESDKNIFEMRRELKIKKEDFLIISVGELNKNKNHELVIRAIAKINNPQIKYIICGRGVLENYLNTLCKELGLEEQVFILGYRENVSDYLHMSDVFAFPSKREGLGVAALEAMASGLPLIGSNLHGIKDYLKDGVNGCCIDPNSLESMCTAIKKMFTDEEFRKQCRVNNLQTVKKFDLKESIAVMKKIYAEISK